MHAGREPAQAEAFRNRIVATVSLKIEQNIMSLC